MSPAPSSDRDEHPGPPGTRPPTVEEETGLRRVVGELAGVSSRRPAPTLVRVGRPAGASCDFLVRGVGALDATLRVDVLAALLRQSRSLLPTPAVLLTRPGPLQAEDVDLDWFAAARSAYAEAAVPLLMVVVTRHGWYDPGTGRRREWKRLRLDR